PSSAGVCALVRQRLPGSTLFAYTTLFRSVTFEFENVPALSIERLAEAGALVAPGPTALRVSQDRVDEKTFLNAVGAPTVQFTVVDRKSTRLNSSHVKISYAVFCLTKKTRH